MSGNLKINNIENKRLIDENEVIKISGAMDGENLSDKTINVQEGKLILSSLFFGKLFNLLGM